MRRITYAGTWFDTGDEIAAAILEYARALARHNIADTVLVPGRTAFGDDSNVEVIIGPASQIVTASIDLAGKEIEDPGLVAMLRNKTAELR